MAYNLEKNTRKRPLSLWLLLLAYAFFSLNGWVRAVNSLSSWYWLDLAGIVPGPLYLVITGVLWAIVGLAALLWVWLGRPNYRLAGTGAAILFALMYWADRLLVRNPEGSLQNAAFAAGFTFLCLGFVIGTLRPWRDLPK